MAQVSDTGMESIPSKTDASPYRFSTLNFLLGAIALISIIIAATFLVLFLTSKHETNEVARELEREKNREYHSNNEPMTCEWMRECRRERSGAPPLLVISMDGFANRYINWESTPTIKKMGECGGRAESMYPSFPSKTLSNHYTMATGLYPGTHGIVDNSFVTADGTKYDANNGSFYSGEPIWNTVVKNGKVSKTFLWLGSYDKIDGVEATFHQQFYDANIAFVSRIDEVTEWLISDNPPALSMLYLEEPDWTGHKNGPDSERTREAAIKMDGLLYYTLRKLNAAGVLGCTNIVLVSDHGMRTITKYVDLDDIDIEYRNATLNTGNHVMFFGNVSTTSMQCKKGEDYRVYQSKDEFPLRFHYDHENVKFPYMAGNPGILFWNNSNLGNHGWDNMDTQMQAIFYSIGPSIRSNITLKSFQNINLYNFFADLMQIPPAANNGTTGLLDDLLVDPPNRENPFNSYSVSQCENISFEDCRNPNQTIPVSNTTGHMQSRDSSICSISTGRLFLLYSKSTKRTVGMEIIVKKMGSYEGQVVTKLNGQIVGSKCGEDRVKSVLTSSVLESSLMLTWTHFHSLPLIEKVIAKLAKRKSTRIQIGFAYGSDGSTKSVFVSGFWCEGSGWRQETDYCLYESDTRTESYVIPASAIDNFNCLDDNAIIFDYRTTLADIENLTGLSLLPKSMPISIRRRISVFLPNQTFE